MKHWVVGSTPPAMKPNNADDADSAQAVQRPKKARLAKGCVSGGSIQGLAYSGASVASCAAPCQENERWANLNFSGPSDVADTSSDHELRRQDALAEGHLRIVQSFEQHFHAGLADLFLVYPDRRQWRIHQDGLFAIVKAHEADFVRHFYSLTAQPKPKSVCYFVVAGHHRARLRPSRHDSLRHLLAQINKTLRSLGRYQHRFQFSLAHRLAVSRESALKPRKG